MEGGRGTNTVSRRTSECRSSTRSKSPLRPAMSTPASGDALRSRRPLESAAAASKRDTNDEDTTISGEEPTFWVPGTARRPTHIYAKPLAGAKGSGAAGRRAFWDAIGGGLKLGKGESRVLAGLTLLGSVVRFWQIGRPSSVV